MAAALQFAKPRISAAQFLQLQGELAREQRRVADAFSNPSARLGFGTPHMIEGTQYPFTRLTRNYILMISLYRSNWIVRKVIDAKAEDMLKNGWELTSQNTPEQLDDFNKVQDDTGTQAKLMEALKWARLYGGAGALIVIEGDDDLMKPLDAEDIELGSYKGLLVFDRWSGISPSGKLSADFNDPTNFGLPEFYQITTDTARTVDVHHSRILKFTGRTLPRWELQAEQYWGISEVEIMYEELKKHDNTSWNIASLIFRANILALKQKDLSQLLSGLGAPGAAQLRFFQMMQAQSELMSNQGVVILPEEGGLENHSYSFGGVADVWINFMMQICGATEYPMTRLFGRTATGLGQSNESDEHIYYSHIAQLQKQQLDPPLKKLLPVIAMSTWGKIPDDFGWKFNPVRSLTDKDQADLAKSNTDAVVAAFNAGITGRKTSLQELQQQADVTGLFSNITDEQVESAEEEPAAMGEELGEFGEEMSAVDTAPDKKKNVGYKINAVLNTPDAEKKMTKAEVNFEHPAKGKDQCGDCKYFQGSTCAIVEGLIREEDWCEEFKRKTQDAVLEYKDMEFQGLHLNIENLRGSVRHGKTFHQRMTVPYGYIQQTEGADGDAVDVFVGPLLNAPCVYIIHTKNLATGDYDEDKVMLGFASAREAQQCFVENYSEGDYFDSMDKMDMAEFVKKLKTLRGKKIS